MNVLNEWAFIGVFFVMAPVLPALPIHSHCFPPFFLL